MITVKEIIWLDKDSREGNVILSDGKYCVECFCSDCELSVGDSFFDIIYGFDVTNFYRSFDKESKIVKTKDGYYIKGKLVDRKNGILQLGEFRFDLTDGDIPKDIKENEFVEANLSRIDIY
ncbi:hypothetical protein K7P65_002530 [Enterococcus faecalis]|uniref:hypothetical protein n=1 Tax=Enterococcus faecalis TaxID=1351 RepID=UPI00115F4A34|nr:hypothetical protein [Enterococcus faecalis]EGO5829998.1 hypothetical protein [Enterococcus faecalis]EGO6036402.1 hypothetical protein [Enterococcus faecalis]EHU9649353.1 hypothetical protein [Enterococcus faecalis]EHU9677067.1 hypothetical protein [Enterococcus faecalis]EIA6405373.1 hypothetical protein [Enterococcus faecalis]